MPLDDYNSSSALSAYYPSRDERRPARIWAKEKLLHDMKEVGFVDFFEGPGSNPTTISGYGLTKLWLRVSAGVTDQQGEIRAYAGAGDATLLASWPEMTRGNFLAFLGVNPDLGRFETRLDVVAAVISSSVNGITVLGHAAVGDGGAASYKRVSSEPSHSGKIQSADGTWWEIITYTQARFETRSDLAAARVPAGLSVVRTMGYTAAGDGGGALYTRAVSEPSHEGKVQSTDGAWWELSERTVNYSMFGVDITGASAADDEMLACHEYANAKGAKVEQKSGTVLWRSEVIPVKTDCDLGGLTVVMDDESGDDTPNYAVSAPYHIQRSVAGIAASAGGITAIQTSHATELVPGSKRCTHQFFSDNPFSLIVIKTATVDIVRSLNDAEQDACDVALTSRDGNLAVGFDVNVATNITSITAYPREASRLVFNSPRFVFNGVATVGGVLVERNQVDIKGLIQKELIATPDDSVRQIVRLNECWDVQLDEPIVEGQDPTNGTGTYGFYGFFCIDVKVRGAYGFGGWGIQAWQWTKRLLYDRCSLNRIDGHWRVYDVETRGCQILNTGVRLAGGGYYRSRGDTWAMSDYDTVSGDATAEQVFWSGRNDYGSDFDGEIDIDGLRVEVGTAPTAAEVANGITIVRPGQPLTYDHGRNVSSPQVISIRNVTISVRGNVGTEASPVRVRCVLLDHYYNGPSHVVYWPSVINVDGVRFVDMTPDQILYIEAISSFDYSGSSVFCRRTADTVNRHGTNAHVTIKNVVPQFSTKYVPNETGGILRLVKTVADWSSHYASDDDAWLPRISVENCPHVVADAVIRGVLLFSECVIHRVDYQRTGAGEILCRLVSCDIKPIDRTVADGSVSFEIPTANRAAYIGCTFYIPLDNIGDDFVSDISLASAIGLGNDLRDGATAGTHYTNAPSGFFLA